MATTTVQPGQEGTNGTNNQGTGNTSSQSSNVKTFTQEQVDALLGSVRTEEKNKLYTDLNHHKDRAQRLETELTTLKTQQTNTSNTQQQEIELQKKIEALQAAQADIEAKWTDRLTKAVEQTINESNAAFQRQRIADRVADRKEAEIKASDGKIVPQLVTGNTVEEVEASAKLARETWQQIYEAGKTEAAKKALPHPIQPGGGNTSTGTTEQGLDEVTELKNLRNLPPQEQEQRFADIKKRVYEKIGLPMKQ